MYNYQEGEGELKLVSAFLYCSMIVNYGIFLIIVGCEHMYGVFLSSCLFGVDLVFFLFGFSLILLFVCFLCICSPLSVHCSSVGSNDLFIILIQVTP